MHFVIYCPGMPFNGATLAEGKSLGGSESAACYMARELALLGHQVTAFTGITAESAGIWDGVRYLSAGAVTEDTPLGADFEWYAASTPHDVLIMQRVPDAFRRRFAAKVNLWWSHDLALKRHQPRLAAQLWNVDRVLAVSEFHSGQIAEVYGIPASRIVVVPNGVEHSLYAALPAPGSSEDEAEARRKRESGVLVYSSRPERGLEALVRPGGLMECLARSRPELRLSVAGYDNTAPHMRPLYEVLWGRCRELPNVELLGPLSKKELADLMRSAWLHVYPTTFEEVSCITAMEAQAAGTPVITSRLAALPETLQEGGAALLDPDSGSLVEQCEAEILALHEHPERWNDLHRKALVKAKTYSWRASAETLVAVAGSILAEKSSEPGRLARHLLRHSDILACEHLLQDVPPAQEDAVAAVRSELDTHYRFVRENGYGEHYEAFARWQNERGIDQGHRDSQRLLAIPRFRVVEELVARLPQDARVLDYACGQGHFTCLLAERYPGISFQGVDIAPAAIEVGRRHIAEKGLENVALRAGDTSSLEGPYDLILACEILEHVAEPDALADALESHLAPGGSLCFTVPYGPWEAESYASVPFRTHIHHFERPDLLEMLGHKPDYQAVSVPVQFTAQGEPLGAYRVTFGAGGAPAGRVDWARKLNAQAPRETLSVCMICTDDGKTLARTLESVSTFADQIVIGIDGAPERSGPAWEIADRYGAESFSVKSPLEIGFGAARNLTLERARGDWVLWIDDDEVFEWPERLDKYLRPNCYDAYAVKQHHYAVEPEGLIKTDFPCRIFRNGAGFRFFGFVHEHPELEINQGAGQVLLLPDVAICHNGYETEEIRRTRFRRNLPLMLRDRAEFPERILGKFLWIRDLAHLNRYALERGAAVTPQMHAQAEEAVGLWRELLEQGHLRMAVDALPYYSEAVELLRGEGIQFELAMGASLAGVGDLNGHPPPTLRGRFMNTDDILLLTGKLAKDKTSIYEEKYF